MRLKIVRDHRLKVSALTSRVYVRGATVDVDDALASALIEAGIAEPIAGDAHVASALTPVEVQVLKGAVKQMIAGAVARGDSDDEA